MLQTLFVGFVEFLVVFNGIDLTVRDIEGREFERITETIE